MIACQNLFFLTKGKFQLLGVSLSEGRSLGTDKPLCLNYNLIYDEFLLLLFFLFKEDCSGTPFGCCLVPLASPKCHTKL